MQSFFKKYMNVHHIHMLFYEQDEGNYFCTKITVFRYSSVKKMQVKDLKRSNLKKSKLHCIEVNVVR